MIINVVAKYMYEDKLHNISKTPRNLQQIRMAEVCGQLNNNLKTALMICIQLINLYN